MQNKEWTPDDVSTLQSLAKRHTCAQAAELMGRSHESVRKKAAQLSVRFLKRDTGKKPHWTDAEIESLREMAKTYTCAEAARLLGRGYDATKKKAQAHSISFTERAAAAAQPPTAATTDVNNRYARWTDDDIRVLADLAKMYPSTQIAVKMGRGVQSVRKKAAEHSIRFLVENDRNGLRFNWTKRDETVLMGLAEKCSMAQAAAEMGRSRSSLRKKAQKLGISFRDRRLTLNDVASILGVTLSTVVRRRDRLRLDFRTTKQNRVVKSSQTRGADGADIVALAKDILANPPMGRPHKGATASRLRKVIEEYEGWE